MTIMLKDIWPIDRPAAFKLHFARWDKENQPLEVWTRDKREWQGWQEYRPAKDDFNRPLIFSLIQFYHETDIWLFGGMGQREEQMPLVQPNLEISDSVRHRFAGQ